MHVSYKLNPISDLNAFLSNPNIWVIVMYIFVHIALHRIEVINCHGKKDINIHRAYADL